VVRTHAPAAGHLYVVRHADAGVRRAIEDDHLRPLNPSGRARAAVLADLLEPVAVGDIVSSPYSRCVETVQPLAERRGRTVALDDALAEGASIDAVLGLLHRLPDGSVACTHGDLLGHLSDVVVDARPDRERPIFSDKGGVWVVSRHDGSLLLADEIRAPRSSDHGDHGTPSKGEEIAVRQTSSSDGPKES